MEEWRFFGLVCLVVSRQLANGDEKPSEHGEEEEEEENGLKELDVEIKKEPFSNMQ